MKIKISLILLISLMLFKNIYSQTVNSYDLKTSINIEYETINFEKILDLIENFKNNEIEILTLEMIKINKLTREIEPNRICFGEKNYNSGYYNRFKEYLIKGDFIFSKNIISSKINDNKFNYHLDIFLNQGELYNIIIEIGKNKDFLLKSTETQYGNFKRMYEYSYKEKNTKFVISTNDQDKLSKITFSLMYTLDLPKNK